MNTRNLSICDPFDLTHRTPAQAAADLGLRLLSGSETRGGATHELEAWDLQVHDGGFVWGQFSQWRIDPENLRPRELEMAHTDGVIRRRFLFDTVNQPLPGEAFAVPRLEGVLPSATEPLDAGYTKRFINLRDGSDGRMSVRWGKHGPKGTSSSGLN